jgi:TonB family protein
VLENQQVVRWRAPCIAARRQVTLMYASQARSTLVSGLLHVAGIVLVLVATKVTPVVIQHYNAVPIAERDISPYLPAPSNGGGGGGARELTPASKGVLPRAALRQFVPPTTHILNDNPRLAMEMAIVAPPDVSIPVSPGPIGLPDGIPGPPSDGMGRNGGIGDTGDGGGVGNRRGPGAGNQGDYGGISGTAGMGGVVTRAVLQWKAEPEYSEEARKARLQGTVVLRIVIDARGQATNIEIAHSLGLGLDERAVESVRRWRFRPAMQNGKPVPSSAIVEVNFRLL